MQIIRTYLDKGLRTDLDVMEMLAALNEPKVGTKHICNIPTHCAPFRALADIVTWRVLYAVIWACRSGSKTYLFGGFDTWIKCCSKARLEVKILGGSEEQSRLSYEAMDSFWKLTGLDEEYLASPMAKQSAEFKDGSKVSILAASQKSVRGAHPQILKLDEVDEIDSAVYESALSQPQGKYGIPSSLLMFSTNHNVDGQMDRAICAAQEQNNPVYKYCVWECIESCRDYVCSTCQLSPYCPGKQVKEADGYYRIDDFIRKLQTASWDTMQRDWFCVKVGRGNLVYQNEWHEETHLVNVPLSYDKPVVLSVDFGGVDPFSVGVYQKAPPNFGEDSWVRVTELFMSPAGESVTNQKVIRTSKLRPWAPLVKEIICDSSRPDLIQEWREAYKAAKVYLCDKKSIDEGIEATKAALSPVLGNPKLYVNRMCSHVRREFSMYAINPDTGKIIDKHNHTMDDVRYFVMAKIRKEELGYIGMLKHDPTKTK